MTRTRKEARAAGVVGPQRGAAAPVSSPNQVAPVGERAGAADSRSLAAVVDPRMIPLTAIATGASDGRQDRNSIAELAASMRASGLINPVTLRPRKDGFELVAGRRRVAAAAQLGWKSIPAFVRQLTDAEALTIRIVENDQRDDVHPLDQADNYRQLSKLGHSLAAIAGMVGRPEKHVYDRVRLSKLVPDAQRLFREERIGIAHAVILSRLKAEDQQRAIKPPDTDRFVKERGLWRSESTPSLWDEESKDPLQGYHACTAAELQDWVDHHVRLDRNSPDLPQLFEATAANIVAAEAKREKIIPITEEYHLQDGAKDPKERTYGPMSWKRADGELAYDERTGKRQQSKYCERGALGVVVGGRNRGSAYRVCIDKACRVHWKQEQRESRAVVKAKATGNTAREEKLEQERQAREARADQERARWKKASPAILEAVARAIAKLPATPQSKLGQLLLSGGRGGPKNLSPGKDAESLVRYLAFHEAARCLGHEWSAAREGTRLCADLGLDAKKLLDQHAPVAPAGKPSPATGSAAKKKPAKRGAR